MVIQITEKKKRGRPPKVKDNIEQNSLYNEENLNKLFELCSLVDYITQTGSGSSLNDISLTDLYNYFRNPYKNIKSLRLASEYLTLKHGVIRDVLLAFSRLPTLNYHLSWSSFDNPKQIKKYEKRIYDFLDEIKVKRLLRDGLYETAKDGTVVSCLRKEKYVQFLELDNLRSNKQKNGRFVIEYDLSTIKQLGMSTTDIEQVIESLPDEISLNRYNLYKNKGDTYRFVEINNVDLIKYGGTRNYPYGFPLSMGCWASLIQKEIINRVERSQADSLIKKVLILTAGYIGDDKSKKPVPKNVVEFYFNSVKSLLLKKDTGATSTTETSGTGLVSLPEYLQLKPLDLNITHFTKELYVKIQNDIFMNLGVSESLIYGSSQNSANFSAAQINVEKFFRYIFDIIEQFEEILNGYIKQLLPVGLNCKLYFDKTTILDRDKYIDKCKEFYMQTGIFTPWAESLLGIPYHYALGLARYEKEVLEINKYIYPAQNAFNQTGENPSGRPEGDPNSEGGMKTKNSNGNNNPSPSD